MIREGVPGAIGRHGVGRDLRDSGGDVAADAVQRYGRIRNNQGTPPMVPVEVF